MHTIAVLFFVLLAFASGQKSNYDGYKVLRLNVQDLSQGDILRSLEAAGKYDFWTEIRKSGSVDVMVNPEEEAELLDILDSVQITHSVMIDDVQSLVEQSRMASNEQHLRQGHNMDWDSYHPLEDMYGYFDYLEGTLSAVTTFFILSFYFCIFFHFIS